MLSILAIAAAVYLFLIFMGWGASLLILPVALRPYQLWLAPWVGLLIIDISLVWFGRLGIGTEKSVYFVCFIGISLLCVCWYRKVRLRPSLTKPDLIMAGATLIALTLALSPLLWVDGIPTTISMGNNDPQCYALVSDFLKTHGIYPRPKFQEGRPNSYVISLVLQPGMRPGTFLLYSAIASLLKLSTYQIYTIVTGIFFALTPSLISIFTRIATATRSSFTAVCALSLSLLNINFLYFNYQGFGAQIIAQGFLIFAFLIFYQIHLRSEFTGQDIILLSACISTLLTLYVELVPFFVLPSAMCILFLLFRKRTNRKKIIISIIYALLLIILIDPLSIIDGFQWFTQVSQIKAGWPMPRWALPADMVGLFSIYTLNPIPNWITLTANLLVIYTIFLGIRHTQNKSFWISLLTFKVMILGWLCFVREYSYGYHKAMAFLCFANIIIFSMGLQTLVMMLKKYIFRVKNRNSIKQGIQLGTLGVLVISSSIAILPVFDQMLENHATVDPSLSQLSRLSNIVDTNQKIYLDEPDVWKQMWAAKFLGDRPFSFLLRNPSSNPYYSFDKFAEKTFPSNALLLRRSNKQFIRDLDEEEDRRMIWQGDYYTLEKAGILPMHNVSLGENWHSSEISWLKTAGSDEFRWLKQDATLKLSKRSSEQITIELSIQFVPIVPQTTAIDLYLNERLLETVQISDVNYHVTNISLTQPQSTLRIHVREGAVVPSNSDPREITVGVNSIRFRLK